MPVPHDPAHRARLTFAWRDERWHLLDDPCPAVVLISAAVSRGDDYANPVAAQTAFWTGVVDSILAANDHIASATWPGVEIAAALDKINGRAAVAERTRRGGPQVRVHEGRDAALADFHDRIRALISKSENAA